VQLPASGRDTLVVPTVAVDVLVGAVRYSVDEATVTLSPANRALSAGEVILGGEAA